MVLLGFGVALEAGSCSCMNILQLGPLVDTACLVLQGLSNKDGLGTLFFRMKNVAWGIAQGKAIALALPYIQKTWLWHQLAHHATHVFNVVSSWVVNHLPGQLRGMIAVVAC